MLAAATPACARARHSASAAVVPAVCPAVSRTSKARARARAARARWDAPGRWQARTRARPRARRARRTASEAGRFSGGSVGAGACKACPRGLSSAAGTAAAAHCSCPAGSYRVPATLQTSGSCSMRPGSLEACPAAAAELGLCGAGATEDGISSDDRAARYLPPGCCASGGLKYNARAVGRACGSGLPCICGPFCAGCVSGRYTDQLGQSACKGSACPLGRFGPQGSTNSSTATCTACEAGRFSGDSVGAARARRARRASVRQLARQT